MAENKQTATRNFSKIRNRKKLARTILQIIILSSLCLFVAHNIFYTDRYQPYTDKTQDKQGFIAISYFGVQRTEGSQQLIAQDRLKRQLASLKKQGYETITAEDIFNYYNNGGKLPARAVYLMFEDGRRDTAIFAKDILENLNYKATMFTYANNFNQKDNKFLTADDLKKLSQSSYWELGSNGYRLFYINVFDRYNNYLGEMNPLIFSMVHEYLGRRYNHYLMDYIRDKNGIPKESYTRMKNRISYDYEKLENSYMNEIGSLPPVSILMHANTGSFGNNPQVSAVNAYWLTRLFKMNFNREGAALNTKDSSIYDLTRIQPQAWWPTNHLLMRIKYNTNQNMDFETGDEARSSMWTLVEGACEFIDEKIYLTSQPKGQGITKLKTSGSYKNIKLDVRLQGNKQGTQEILLRSDDSMNNYVSLVVNGRNLIIKEKLNGKERQLASGNIDKINGVPAISLQQDEQNAKKQELTAFSRYSPSAEQSQIYLKRLKSENAKNLPPAADSSQEYIPAVNANEKGDETVSLTLQDDTMSVMLNGRDALSAKVSRTDQGSVFLIAAWSDHGFDQRNLSDNVYDAVFDGLTITNLPDENNLFTSKYTGIDKLTYNIKKYGENVVGWFVKYL